MSSRTSPTLLGRLRQNPTDQATWSAFVQRYGPKIYGWCRGWHLQQADAEDVTQTVLLRVAEKMGTFRYDPSGSFRGWLKTLTHHAWRDWAESRQRPGASGGDGQALEKLQTLEARDDLLQRLEHEFDLELLEEAIARVRLRLPARKWEVFRLTAIEGLSGAEVAKTFKMKVATVYVVRSKVQKLLQDEVRKLEADSAD